MNRQKHKLSRRILAVLLMAAMLITMLPSAMFAQDGQAEGQQTPVAVNNGSGVAQDSVKAVSEDGITINKSVAPTDTGYELTLEAYASEKVSTEVAGTAPLDIVLVLDQSGSMADPFSQGETRRQALQNAARGFVDSVRDNGGANHRIGIVTFDNNAETLGQGFTDVSSEGAEQLKTSIDWLSADGATRVDRGLKEANDLLNSARSDAQKIVIVFTDGDPTSGNSFENEVAADAINTAYTIKQDKGATIYTIGIFSGANPNTDNKSNNYMNAMSSNYPEATADGDNGGLFGLGAYFNIFWTGDDDTDKPQPEGNYYLAAKNSEELNAVFEQIYEEIGGLTSNPTTGSVLSDTVSQYFVLPDGTDKDDITVEYVEAVSYDENTGFTFEQSGTSPADIEVTISVDEKTIEVTGFDYKANVASAELQDDGTYAVTGGKLVVKIPIELDSQAIKGTGIYDTNDTAQNKAGLDYFDKDGKPTDLKLDKSPSVAVTAYTVTYDLDGGTANPAIDSENYLAGQTATVTSVVPEKTGYTFTGWKWNNEVYETGNSITVNSNITLVAQWEKNSEATKTLSYTVEYYKDGVLVEDDTQTVEKVVWVNDPDTLTVDKDQINTKDKYTGYKFSESDPETIPDTIETGKTIKVYYVKDSEATKTLKYTVEYYKDGVLVEDDTQTVEKVVWVNDPDTLTVDKDQINTEDKYEGYELEKTEPAEIPETIENKGTIKVYYISTTYDLNYNANGGKYQGNFKDQEAATVFGLDSGDYDIWTIGENGKETGKMPESEFLPIHEPVIDTDTEEEIPVVFVGWSEKEEDTLYKKGDYLPDTVLYKPGTQVTIADADKTLYAVWGYDKNENGTADVLEKLTLTYDINGGYGTEPVDRNPYMKGDQVTLETEALPVHVAADDGTAVVFLGWGLKQVDEIFAAGQDYSAAGVTESVTFEDEDITVYAVWGYDENNDGVADATQVLITPADITAYTGGTPYGGIADINGDIITESVSGLPEPGYFITLPYDVQQWLNAQTGTTVGATNLHDYMTFTYKGTDGSGGTTTREWKLEYQGVYETDENGNALRYVYSLAPATVDGKEIPVRLNYFKDTNNNGKLDETETALTNDDILMSKDLAHDTFSMTINPGELDQSVIKAAFNANGDTKDSAVGIGTGTLTVKSVTDVGTTTNAIGNSESDVTENTLTAVANGSVTYYVNDSQVDADNKTDRVQLLVDSVSNNDGFNAQMGQHAIETVEGSSDTHDYELAYMDLVDTANGNAEIKLGANDKLTIYWPMPENADPDGDFQVVHYTDMNREGTVDDLNAVTTQTLKATQVTVNGKAYLTFEVSSFSPFALVYTADNGSDTPDYPDYPIWTPDGDDDGPSGLNTEDHFSYVVGYAEDYRTGEATDNEDLWPVKPNNQITRAEVATIFYRLLEDEVRDEYDTTTNDFSDVTADSWYNQTVSTLARMGIVKGYEDGSFRPNAPITRAELGAIATRFFAETGATYEPGTFTDVTGDEWFANAIQDAVNLGLIGGYPDGTVRPNNNITRAEACAIVNRTLGRVPDADHLLPEDVMKVWPDNNPTDWFYADMQEATNGHEYAWIEEDGHEIEEWTNLLDKDWTDR